MNNEIDWNFIHIQEGMSLKGYVPKNADGTVMGHSGVTIGTGYDLGSHTLQEIQALNLDKALYEKLSAYVGKQGNDAVYILKTFPLSLTTSECMTLMCGVEDHYADQIASAYNKTSPIPFNLLPPEAQTVLMSVAYQYGINLAKKTPKFWGAMTTQNWSSAVYILKNFGDSYIRRRLAEATVLQKLL